MCATLRHQSPCKAEAYGFRVRTERPVSAGLPLVADLAAGIYQAEGEGYIAGYEGNNEGEVDDLEPARASWDTMERLYYCFGILTEQR